MFVGLLAMWICFVWMLAKTAEQRLLLKEKDVYISDLEKDADVKRGIIKEMLKDIRNGYCENRESNIDDLFEIEILDDVKFNESGVNING